MRLKPLLGFLRDYQVFGNPNIEIVGVTDDSRKVSRGCLFVAVKGLTVDGHKFINTVVSKGALAIVGEKSPKEFNLKNCTYIKVKNSRVSLGLLACAWFGNPAPKMKIIGVTGTDGKTTTANLIYWILKSAGRKVGLVSTVSAKIGGKEYDTGFHVTNPEPLALQEFLKKMVDAKTEYVVLEVTSHGLDQERVAGINFDMAVLTNITHEHLDYHKTFENYVKAKGKLFLMANTAVINREGNSFHLINKYVNKKAKIIRYSIQGLSNDVEGAVFKRFPENYNRGNAAAAIEVAKALEVGEKDVVSAISTFPAVPGRMEEITNKKGIRVIVDFAHTPNALESVLTALKSQCPKNKKLITVFGCAGERDIQKRPMMGEISTRIADISIFTAEDPRTEKIENIFEEMVGGIQDKSKKYYLIADRKKAIEYAINALASKGDIIAICGKGHEKSMNLGHGEIPWSDQKVARKALK